MAIVTGHRVHDHRRVAHGFGKWADLIERRRERGQSEARNAAITRLDANNAAERRRLSNRTAGVGAESRRMQRPPQPQRPSRRSNRRERATSPTDCASTFTLEFSVDEPIANSSMFVLPNGIAPAARKFLNHGRVVRRAIIPENFRAAGARLTGHVDDVLDRDRHAAERKIDVDLFGFLQRSVEIDREISVDLRFDFFNAGAKRLDHFAR